ncbi:hypothetical protein HNP73_001593 [Amaricoccus macauensis]|uniref:Uncharacterized protein n=1 Tax=Amaricoccus macauensis TaxID=57001 RepID=A0A840SIF4_9RHOB|nr:hypothetical protein [Amaricoccus macauensis]MBB5221657.1 hypothetical protein [Amaricoccus macauensis]
MHKLTVVVRELMARDEAGDPCVPWPHPLIYEIEVRDTDARTITKRVRIERELDLEMPLESDDLELLFAFEGHIRPLRDWRY